MRQHNVFTIHAVYKRLFTDVISSIYFSERDPRVFTLIFVDNLGLADTVIASFFQPASSNASIYCQVMNRFSMINSARACTGGCGFGPSVIT